VNVGAWVSRDPMRQFASPYATSGNLINNVDKDGTLEFSITYKEYDGQRVNGVNYVLNLNAIFRDQLISSKTDTQYLIWSILLDLSDGIDMVMGGSGNSQNTPITRAEQFSGKLYGPIYNVGNSFSLGMSFGDDGDIQKGIMPAFGWNIGILGNLSDQYCGPILCGKGIEFGFEASPSTNLNLGIGIEETKEK